MMFELARRILLWLPPELAHGLSLRGVRLAQRLGYTQRVVHPIYKPVELMGLKFRNRVGLDVQSVICRFVDVSFLYGEAVFTEPDEGGSTANREQVGDGP